MIITNPMIWLFKPCPEVCGNNANADNNTDTDIDSDINIDAISEPIDHGASSIPLCYDYIILRHTTPYHTMGC